VKVIGSEFQGGKVCVGRICATLQTTEREGYVGDGTQHCAPESSSIVLLPSKDKSVPLCMVL